MKKIFIILFAILLFSLNCVDPEPDLFITFKNNSEKELLVNPYINSYSEKHEDKLIGVLSDYQYTRIIVYSDSFKVYEYYSGEINMKEFLHIEIYDKNIYDSLPVNSTETLRKSLVDYLVLSMDSVQRLDFIINYP
jgi:hypothetical protein